MCYFRGGPRQLPYSPHPISTTACIVSNDGEFVKKCLRDVVEIFSPENNKLKRMISDVQLSRHTVERRISDISMPIKSKLHSDFQAYEYFSIALDESCDIQDKPQLAIFDGLFQTIV